MLRNTLKEGLLSPGFKNVFTEINQQIKTKNHEAATQKTIIYTPEGIVSIVSISFI